MARSVGVVTVVAMTMSVSVSVLLARKLRDVQRLASPGLHAGERLPESVIMSGRRVSVVNTGTVVYYHFSPTCGWCERNWPNVQAAMRASAGRLRFIGLSVDPVAPEFLKSRGLDIEVLDNLSPETVRAFGLGATPQTIVASEGVVLDSWFGAYAGTQRARAELRLGTPLPGLAPPRVR